MKLVKNALSIIALSILSFSCTPDVVIENVKSEDSTSLRYQGGDDDIIDESEKDDE